MTRFAVAFVAPLVASEEERGRTLRCDLINVRALLSVLLSVRAESVNEATT